MTLEETVRRFLETGRIIELTNDPTMYPGVEINSQFISRLPPGLYLRKLKLPLVADDLAMAVSQFPHLTLITVHLTEVNPEIVSSLENFLQKNPRITRLLISLPYLDEERLEKEFRALYRGPLERIKFRRL